MKRGQFFIITALIVVIIIAGLTSIVNYSITQPEPIKFSSEQDLLHQLRPKIDGLILTDHGHRGTFLPSVWDQLPTPELFWSHLKLKAGLPPDHWSDTLQVARYTAESIP